ncbi:hypothetical protein GDO86_007106 [Hymenochirus boettgeri]|uniref:HMG box-containing protein 4 n=1 Tax=Hymenochirus boettgeri TaxID=247094 RepID=A0A8T2IVB4_9PIPI|nr:hypothetical protein GDO86_007106 [Hymenochirus boettgeri]KAG8435883.1 hypothetical protein GDO86_007106 [Hymenochirus boettgeri]
MEGLAAGRSQREKKRSYKDLLREEEEIAEQVRKSSKKKPKDLELLVQESESHKKKKKHLSEDSYYADFSSPDTTKKKKKTSLPSPTSPSSDTAMDLLKAITSPQADSSTKLLSKKADKNLATPVGIQSPSHQTHKEHRKKSADVSGDDSSHREKKSKPLTLREPDGLRMKLVLSPNEKQEEQMVSPQCAGQLSEGASSKKSSKKTGREDPESRSSHKKHKKDSDTHRSGGTPNSASSSAGELEVSELVIDDALREVKKKKKSKKSKKKKDKHRDEKHRKHSKSKKEHEVEESSSKVSSSILPSPPLPVSTASPATPPSVPLTQAPVLMTQTEGASDKKKKKEETEKTKKKNMSAYQVFSKEYRVSIIAEHPGIDFGELSKKLAEVWKQLPEKDKLVWKQKAQYLQHKQNKAEATTVKRKSSSSESAPRSKGLPSPNKKSPTSIVSFSASPVKVPDTEPIDVAAHLQLLGESLSLIGHRLQETEGMVAVSGSLSVLLDSILCALGPLVCLTSHVPQLNACPRQVLSNTLDNITYVMPGL